MTLFRRKKSEGAAKGALSADVAEIIRLFKDRRRWTADRRWLRHCDGARIWIADGAAGLAITLPRPVRLTAQEAKRLWPGLNVVAASIRDKPRQFTAQREFLAEAHALRLCIQSSAESWRPTAETPEDSETFERLCRLVTCREFADLLCATDLLRAADLRGAAEEVVREGTRRGLHLIPDDSKDAPLGDAVRGLQEALESSQ